MTVTSLSPSPNSWNFPGSILGPRWVGTGANGGVRHAPFCPARSSQGHASHAVVSHAPTAVFVPGLLPARLGGSRSSDGEPRGTSSSTSSGDIADPHSPWVAEGFLGREVHEPLVTSARPLPKEALSIPCLESLEPLGMATKAKSQLSPVGSPRRQSNRRSRRK